MLHIQFRLRAKGLWTADWFCRSTLLKTSHSVRLKSTAFIEKPYYVTTPIFYVNASPHIGHLYSMVLSDILKRWQVLKGRKTLLCTGTDEHGLKIQQAAADAKMGPAEFCDKGAETFKELAQRAAMSNDYFIRTTDTDHKEAVTYIWKMLTERGFIYPSKHEGWYSISDETFCPKSAVVKQLDPFSGRTYMASSETGKEVEWTEEPNYHFRLSLMKEPLLKFYKDNPMFVVPSTRMADVVRWVSEGLEDLSVSRPVERLDWGIRVPGDESQTIYVWLDALVNYITKAGYPWAPGNESAGGWPADVQVVGKDIVRFHCIYWPAFLLALEIPPPKQVLAHAHWTMSKQKMSKSTGNVVNPFYAIDRFGIDTMRYYLAHSDTITNDSDYGNLNIIAKYKKGLQSGLGNLVSRVTRPKMWNVRISVKAARDGLLPNLDIEGEEHVRIVKELRDNVSLNFDELNPCAALHYIMRTVYKSNRYLQSSSPWNISQTDPDSNRVERIVYDVAEAIRIIGILLQPYMPGKAKALLDMLGVDDLKRTFDDAQYGADYSYGTPKALTGTGIFDSLFPPLAVVD